MNRIERASRTLTQLGLALGFLFLDGMFRAVSPMIGRSFADALRRELPRARTCPIRGMPNRARTFAGRRPFPVWGTHVRSWHAVACSS